MTIQFFIYLLAELNSQWPIIESIRIQATTPVRQHRTEQTKTEKQVNWIRQVFLHSGVIKMSVHLQTALAGETCLAEGQWPKEHQSVVKL